MIALLGPWFYFKCYWYDQDKTQKRNPKNDGYFTSINTDGQWYQEEPYVLAPQVSKVLFLDDISRGKSWQIVQKFQPRHMYDVDENERLSREVSHQDDEADLTGKGAEVTHDTFEKIGNQDEGFTVEVSIVDREINKWKTNNESKEADDADEDEDPTMEGYMDVDDSTDPNNDDGVDDD